MQTAAPGQTIIITEPGLPSGAAVGFQVINAATGLASITRTEVNVTERPAGSGNYVIVFAAPALGDLYLIVVDWTAGVLAPETTKVTELRVSEEVTVDDSMGYVATYTRQYLGAATWAMLQGRDNFGDAEIALVIDTVKRRVFSDVVSTATEQTLDPLVLDYLGLLVAISLIPAARDGWGDTFISRQEGLDPIEAVTFANRAALMDDLLADLRGRLPAAQAIAIPLIPDLRQVLTVGCVPEIDEEDWPLDRRVTADPRQFPREREFPFDARRDQNVLTAGRGWPWGNFND